MVAVPDAEASLKSLDEDDPAVIKHGGLLQASLVRLPAFQWSIVLVPT
jgi:hypothetical protein